MPGVTEDGNNNEIMEDCLKRLAAVETSAVEKLYELTRSQVYGYILSILRNTSDAEDILQDTYVKLCLNADQYTPRGKPLAWILTIARNLCLMKLRGRKRIADVPDFDWESVVDENGGPDSEDRMLLEAALSGLSEEESQIVMLHALSGLKHREIAQMMDMPLATVLSKYNRALKKLRKMIGE